MVLKIHNSKQIPLEVGDYRKVWGGRVREGCGCQCGTQSRAGERCLTVELD